MDTFQRCCKEGSISCWGMSLIKAWKTSVKGERGAYLSLSPERRVVRHQALHVTVGIIGPGDRGLVLSSSFGQDLL